jgi:hypothetical protein
MEPNEAHTRCRYIPSAHTEGPCPGTRGAEGGGGNDVPTHYQPTFFQEIFLKHIQGAGTYRVHIHTEGPCPGTRGAEGKKTTYLLTTNLLFFKSFFEIFWFFGHILWRFRAPHAEKRPKTPKTIKKSKEKNDRTFGLFTGCLVCGDGVMRLNWPNPPETAMQALSYSLLLLLPPPPAGGGSCSQDEPSQYPHKHISLMRLTVRASERSSRPAVPTCLQDPPPLDLLHSTPPSPPIHCHPLPYRFCLDTSISTAVVHARNTKGGDHVNTI